MSAAEVLAAHQAVEYVGDGVWWCSCGTAYNAAHQLDALKAAGYVVIELPTVVYKGPHDTDAKFFRQVADRMEWPTNRIDYLGGSNVRQAVRQLLVAAADAAEALP